MMKTFRVRALLAGTMLLGLTTPALAQTGSREAELEARLVAMEAEIAAMRAELAEARTVNVPLEDEPAAEAQVQVASVPPSASTDAEGPRVGLHGYVKLVSSFSRFSDGAPAPNSVGRDFYVPTTIAASGGESADIFEAHAKQTRLVLDVAVPAPGTELGALVEVDFQTNPGTGNQRVTNAYNIGLRRAYLTAGNFLAGQNWTNFQYVSALPETTDYLGPSEGTVFVRQAQLRYSAPLGGSADLAVALENAATVTTDVGSAGRLERGDDSLPDLTARLTWRALGGELSLAGIARELRARNSMGGEDGAFGWGVSAAGKLPFGKRHDARFMATHGEGLGRYVGLNLAPDAVLSDTGAGLQLEPVELTAAFAALRLGWTDKLRSTFMGSFQQIDAPASLSPDANEESWSAAANLFYTPVPRLDVGLEYRHGERSLASWDSGTLDRLEFAAKLGF